MNKTPKLRFKEFSGDWESKKLGEISDIYDGTHQTPKYTNNGVKFVSVENINNIYKVNKYISEEDYNKNFKIKPQLNDIFMTRITAGEIGATAIVDREEDLAYYVSVALIRSYTEKVNSLFLTKCIASKYFKRELNKRIIHVAFPKKINLGDIGDCGVKLPNLEEQEKIASFFSLIDDKISLQSEKVETLKEYKKGMMQKIFSRELRFKDDEGRDYPEWEEKKLEEIATIYAGKRKLLSASGDYVIMDMGSVNSDGNILAHKKTEDSEDILLKGDLVMPKDDIGGGFIIGKTAYIHEDNKYVLGDHVYRIRFNNDFSLFMSYQINSPLINNQLKRKVTGSAQLGINTKSVSEQKLFVPHKDEQSKIGNLLLNIDLKILKELEKLNSLNEYKKGLLQQMFV